MAWRHVEESPQWTSPVIQNELLQITSELILDRIKKDVVTSEQYGIIADETSHISRKEQVSICLSFLDNGQKREGFIASYKTKANDGEALYALVTKAVGECFDGASNMSGKVKGLAALMKEYSPMAKYAVMDTCGLLHCKTQSKR